MNFPQNLPSELKDCINLSAFKYLPFDTDIFGYPYFRIDSNSIEKGESELVKLKKSLRKFACDVKVKSTDLKLINKFEKLGFRKICNQVTLKADLVDLDLDTDPEVIEVSSIDDDCLSEHSSNFTKDRLSMDQRIEKSIVRKFYSTWISNSFTYKKKKVYLLHSGLSILHRPENIVKIDLLSVLEKRKKTASRLLSHSLHDAKLNVAKHAVVTTEINNLSAIDFYCNFGFRKDIVMTCMHLVHA